MSGNMIGFLMWLFFGIVMVAFGIWAHFSRKAVGFWSNIRVTDENVTDVRKYNNAVAKLFCVYGIIFAILGVPLLSGQNSAWILFSVVGVLFESIFAMVIYTTVIEKRYRVR
ncbi:MAG: hypothetical protein PHW47_05770 [Lachnospira sp.]|nr:hypothetical protein [Lachnospira sp.]